MNERFKTITESKLFWFIVSLFASLILWLYVTNTEGIPTEKTFKDVKIQFIGEDELHESSGLIITEQDVTSVDVTLSGLRRDIGKLNSSSLSVTVDLSNVRSEGHYTLLHKVSFPDNVDEDAFTLVDSSRRSVNITVDRYISRKVEVKGSFSGSAAEGDMMASDLEFAMEDYAWRKTEGIEWFNPYALDLSCTTYQTRRMVSVSGVYYSYTGGAHGNSAHRAWNFDLENGTFFGPELLGGAELQTAVTEELMRQSTERAAEFDMKPEELYWADYETILADWPSSAVSFDADGMTVSYSPYELAAYAFGAQIYKIPYDVLEPYLSLQGMEILGLVTSPGA